ncbi:MAG TPA: hypothetical protein VJ375_06070, partial [Gaiellaceae bacterium]|nr:hypothetical protein [Gaiellaceae bacterium]
DPAARSTPSLPFTAPPLFSGAPSSHCPASTSDTPVGSDWGPFGAPNEILPVPADMALADLTQNQKWQVISRYVTQLGCPSSCGYMHAFVKSDEFFWTYSFGAAAKPAPMSWPTISGTGHAVGNTLTPHNVTWGNTPTSFAYQWVRCNPVGELPSCSDIAGATGSGAYTLQSADGGSTLRIKVTATNGNGSTTIWSEPTEVITGGGSGTFGVTSIGSLTDGGGAGYLDLSGPFAIGQTVSVGKLTAYLAGSSGASKLRGVIYADNGGAPGALIGTSNELSIAANAAAGWTDLSFPSPLSLPAGSYWLGFWYADGNGRHYYVDAAGAERFARAAYSATNPAPATFGTASTSTSNYSIYASYTIP